MTDTNKPITEENKKVEEFAKVEQLAKSELIGAVDDIDDFGRNLGKRIINLITDGFGGLAATIWGDKINKTKNKIERKGGKSITSTTKGHEA